MMLPFTSIKSLIKIIVFPLIISILIYFCIPRTHHLYDNRINLFISILSARNHFEKRQSIRKTWINNLFNNHDVRIKAYFIVGDRDCHQHPYHRIDAYSCVSNKLLDNNNKSIDDEMFLHDIESNNNETHFDKSLRKVFRGFSFMVHDSIVITRIGVIKETLGEGRNISVVLLNASNKDILINAEISINSQEHNGMYFESIKSLILPKDFYGLLLIDNEEFDKIIIDENSNQHINWKLDNGLLSILRVYNGFTDFESIKYNENYMVAPTIAYSIADPSSLQSYRTHQEERNNEWNKELEKVNDLLKSENTLYNDLLFVNMIDVYRNLPQKVLRSFEVAMKLDRFTHYLKTDDDCFLNVDNIVKRLNKMKNKPKLWWGNFRRLWPLDYYGKWAEHDYGAPIYPPFACGSGYILSSDIVEWLVANIEFLHNFQGEDVSMGIWLSVINANYLDDDGWLCNSTEKIDLLKLLSHPQLTPNDMYSFENNNMKI